MTIEELLKYSADDIEKMSDEQLIAILSPMFERTRPKVEYAVDGSEEKKVSSYKEKVAEHKNNKGNSSLKNIKNNVLRELEAFGIKIEIPAK